MKRVLTSSSSSLGFACLDSRCGKWGVLLCALLMSLPSTARGQKLEDFKSAASSDKVNVIPFPDIRRNATPSPTKYKGGRTK